MQDLVPLCRHRELTPEDYELLGYTWRRQESLQDKTGLSWRHQKVWHRAEEAMQAWWGGSKKEHRWWRLQLQNGGIGILSKAVDPGEVWEMLSGMPEDNSVILSRLINIFDIIWYYLIMLRRFWRRGWQFTPTSWPWEVQWRVRGVHLGIIGCVYSQEALLMCRVCNVCVKTHSK